MQYLQRYSDHKCDNAKSMTSPSYNHVFQKNILCQLLLLMITCNIHDHQHQILDILYIFLSFNMHHMTMISNIRPHHRAWLFRLWFLFLSASVQQIKCHSDMAATASNLVGNVYMMFPSRCHIFS